MMHKRWSILGVVLVMAILSLAFAPEIANAAGMMQDEPEFTVPDADSLERLSWSAVIAGSVITFVLMFLMNMIGVAIGMTQINPGYGEDSADPKTLAGAGLFWVVFSNLVALFAGGWVAAHFAGIPEPQDGVLHGLLVWALTGTVTTILVMSGIGRMMSGVSSMMSSAMSLTGSVASTAGSATASAAATAGSATASLSSEALSMMANSAQSSAQVISNGLSNLSDAAIENTPDVQNALSYQDLHAEEIRLEIEQMIRDAGHDPDDMKQKAKDSADDAERIAKAVARHPERRDQLLDLAVGRVLRRGTDVANDVDRDSLATLLNERTGMSKEEAQSRIDEWESRFGEVKSQTEKAREVARQKAQEMQAKSEQKADEMTSKAQARIQEMQAEAEAKMQEAKHKAQDAAQATSDAFAAMAAGIVVAMLIGALAAGLGGYLGAPDDLPEVDIDEVTFVAPF